MPYPYSCRPACRQAGLEIRHEVHARTCFSIRFLKHRALGIEVEETPTTLQRGSLPWPLGRAVVPASHPKVKCRGRFAAGGWKVIPTVRVKEPLSFGVEVPFTRRPAWCAGRSQSRASRASVLSERYSGASFRLRELSYLLLTCCRKPFRKLVEPRRFELLTSAVQRRRSPN